MNRIFIIAIIIMGSVIFSLYKWGNNLKAERNRYMQNNDALLSEVRRMQIDSNTMALDVKSLNLTLDEYKRYRAEDAGTIEKMGIRIKSLQMAARHEVEVNAPILADIKDTVVVRDTVIMEIKKVEMITPHLQLCGTIENNRLTGIIHLPVTLRQAVWVEHKHRFLWWRWGVKAVHQTISSDNPHVEIKYSEVINIKIK